MQRLPPTGRTRESGELDGVLDPCRPHPYQCWSPHLADLGRCANSLLRGTFSLTPADPLGLLLALACGANVVQTACLTTTDGRTLDVQGIGRRFAVEATNRRRNRRMDLRTTAEERDLIDRAVAASGTDLTEFVVTYAYQAAQRVLADRDHFELDPSAAKEWEEINSRRTRDLPGLRRLMQRPSPFNE